MEIRVISNLLGRVNESAQLLPFFLRVSHLHGARDSKSLFVSARSNARQDVACARDAVAGGSSVVDAFLTSCVPLIMLRLIRTKFRLRIIAPAECIYTFITCMKNSALTRQNSHRALV